MFRGSYFQISLAIKLSACNLSKNLVGSFLAYLTDKIYVIIVIVTSHARTCLVAFCSNHCFRRVSQDICLTFSSAFIGFAILIFFAVLDVILPQLLLFACE